MKITNLYLKTKYGREIVKNFNLVINKNDKLALIGEEGNGKSTFLKFLYNPNLIDSYCFYAGIRDIRERIGYLPQEFPEEWLSYGVCDYFLKESIFAEENYEIYNDLHIIERLFNKYKLAFKKFEENQIISTLSGGEKIKIQLIKLQYQKNELLLLDEPTNNLDIDTIILLENFIKKSNVPVVYISHDERLLENTCNRILHFEQIKRKTEMKLTLENISYLEYIKLREARINSQNKDAYRTHQEYNRKKQILLYQHQLVQNHLNQAIKNPSQGRILAKKMKNITSQEKKLDNYEVVEYFQPEEAINLFFANEIEVPKGKMILRLLDESIKVNDLLLVRKINLEIKGNEKAVIIGSNGIGKTTLIKKIYELLKRKENILVGYMPQNYADEMDLSIDAISYLQSFLGYDKETKTKIMSCLGAINFVEEEMYNELANLSGGQKAKLYLLKLVLCKNNVLLLDEPTRNLSVLSARVIRRILSSFKGTIVAISHDRAFIEEVADSLYELNEEGLRPLDNKNI